MLSYHPWQIEASFLLVHGIRSRRPQKMEKSEEFTSLEACVLILFNSFVTFQRLLYNSNGTTSRRKNAAEIGEVPLLDVVRNPLEGCQLEMVTLSQKEISFVDQIKNDCQYFIFSPFLPPNLLLSHRELSVFRFSC